MIIRMALKDETLEDQVFDLAYSANWNLHLMHDANLDEDQPHEVVWATTDKKVAIHYIEDHAVDIRYVVIQGDDMDGVLSEIRQKLKVFSREEIFSWIKSAPASEDLIRAVYHLGVIAPERFDQETFAHFEDVLSNPDPDVRLAAIFAITYAGWPEFRPVLTKLATGDPDQRVRKRAKLLLEGFDELPGQ